MKPCSKCEVEKPLEEYYRKHDTKDGRVSFCKPCGKAGASARYRAEGSARTVASNVARRKRIGEAVDKMKEAPCTDCGAQYEPVCMEFDHREGSEKIDAIGHLVHNHWSLERIKSEIDKCDLVCVLCHRSRTHSRREATLRRPYSLAKARNLAILAVAKTRPCEACGEQRHPWQMDFDHRDPTEKRDNVTSLACARMASSVIEAEILKCRIICALCHRRGTAKSEGWKPTEKGAAFSKRGHHPGKRTVITVDEVREIRQRVNAGMKAKKACADVCPHVGWGTAYGACYRGFAEAGPIPKRRTWGPRAPKGL